MCTVLLLIHCHPVLAQVPSTAEPGRIEERFETPQAPTAVPEIEIPGPEAPLPPEEAANIKFELVSILIEGSTVYKDSDFVPLYKTLLGKEVTLKQIYDLRDAITAKYRADGYVLSLAIVPPQKVNGGVHIRIIEGYIDNVSFEGEIKDRLKLIESIGEKIKQSRPLNIRSLERYVLLMDDMPGVSVRTVLKPSKDKLGAADLLIMLKRKSFGGFAAVDNRGSKAIGPVQGRVGFDFNSLLGFNEHNSILLATTGEPSELQYGAIQSDWPLGTEGSRLSLSVGYSHTEPGGEISALESIGTGWTGNLSVTHPLIRSRPKNLTIGAEFAFRNTTNDLLGSMYSEDRVRSIALRASFDAADTFFGYRYPASNIITIEASKGLDIFNATETGSANLSRANGHSDFTKLTVDATRVQTLTNRISLAVALAAQASADPLLSAEQFGLGGGRFGRGYEPSEITGDQGVAGSLEGRYDFGLGVSWFRNPQAYGFYETGKIWNIDPPAGTAEDASLASAGIGTRFDVLDRLSVNLEAAKPLTREVASQGDKNIRIFFSLLTRF